MKYRLKQQLGATLVEVMMAIALSGIVLPVMAGAFAAAHAGRATSLQTLKASSLLREAEDATRSVREANWASVNTNGTYHPVISGSGWALSAGSETINGFSRQVVLSSVQRSASGAIVSSGGTVDPNTKAATVTVAWTTPTSSSVSAVAYLSRWQDNAAWTQTSQADFAAGTAVNTGALASGDVKLLDAPATWQLPSVIGGYNVTGNVAGLTVYEATISSVPYAFVGYSGGLAIVNVSNPASPALTATYTASGQINGIFVVGTTAYLATSSDAGEFAILNVANPASPAVQGTLNLGDTGDANTVYVNGNYAYVGKVAATAGNNEFYIVNVTNPAAPIQTGTYTRLAAAINSICVNPAGTTAYVATAQTNAQLRILDVTSKTAPTSAATVSLGANANKLDCSSGTYVYIATQNNTTAGEVRVYNVTTPTAPAVVGGGYEMGGNITGLDIDPANPNYLFLATSVTAKQATIVNISTPASITLVSNLNVGSVLNKVIVVGSYAYIGSNSTTQELTIVYTGFRPSGSFESSTFDATANAGLNALNFTSTVPSGAALTFQIAANNTGSGWSYLGPDGTAGTSYSTAGAIPLSLASNRYFRYKATLAPTANGQQSPTISDVTLNYSP